MKENIQLNNKYEVSELQNTLEQFGDFLFSRGSAGYDHQAQWLVKDYFPALSFGIIYGASGTLKSFQAIDIACHIATNKSWCAKEVEQGAVVYVAAEGQIGISKRIKAWELANGLSADKVFVLGNSLLLSEEATQEQIITAIQQLEDRENVKVQLLILDTLARCFSGDENSSRDMGAFIAGCDKVKAATSTSVLAVHHTGKDSSKGARGSSVLRAACDYEFHVKRNGQSKLLTFSNTKQKEGAEMPCLELEMETVDLGIVCDHQRPVTSLARKKEAVKKEGKIESKTHPIVDALNNSFSGKATREQLRNLLHPEGNMDNSQRQSFRRAIQALVEKGQITVEQQSAKASGTDTISVLH
ncbi:TPA: AAA family ATPase [Vibrio parahaemolyticus]|nr:AAA family ATPase [Vibrio parahaemolyticus]HAS6508868.1 AAA family ATPase [Vibrio parahaemolyticus]HAS6515626.1 AAA family ATPase [Vibrio parahaemolyticus]HAS6525619.1 AAA family ATPase [Vibrio parahaemolyticus]HAS6540519.1 AAA family ATPase [Vibrio parahaemolyticus]